jgi:hypothetical protein
MNMTADIDREPTLRRGGSARVIMRDERLRRLMLAFLIWGGVLPPVAGGLSDYLEGDMLPMMIGAALRRAFFIA